MTELVTAVICTAFDDATDRAVLAVRDRVIAAGVRLPARPRHRPHVTLAAVRVHPAQLPDVVELVRGVADEHAPFRLSLDRIGTFRRAGALWLGSHADTTSSNNSHTDTTTGNEGRLRTLQRSVHGAVEAGAWPNAFGGRTDPEAWVPHCSLATRLDIATLTRLRAHVAQGFRPIAAQVSGLAVVLVGGAGDVGVVELVAPMP